MGEARRARGEMRNAYKMFVGKSSQGGPRTRRENVKVDFEAVRCFYVGWIHVTQV